MILSRRVALGGVQLDELYEQIVIRSVNTGVPHETIQAVSRMGGSGQRLTSQHWDYLDVQVNFAINVPKRQLELRREIWEAVMTWAMKRGWLTVNYLPGRRMYVDKVILPTSGDLWQWTDEFAITFRAYSVPFWQDEMPSYAMGNVTTAQMIIEVYGNTQTVLNAEFRNISGQTIPNISINAAGNQISLNGVNLGGSETLRIYHRTDGLLQADKGNNASGYSSVYHLITGADDLYVEPGTVPVNIATTRMCRVMVECYGRYV